MHTISLLCELLQKVDYKAISLNWFILEKFISSISNCSFCWINFFKRRVLSIFSLSSFSKLRIMFISFNILLLLSTYSHLSRMLQLVNGLFNSILRARYSLAPFWDYVMLPICVNVTASSAFSQSSIMWHWRSITASIPERISWTLVPCSRCSLMYFIN